MSHFRIVCKMPPRPTTTRAGVPVFLNGELPGICDTSLFFVDDDGKEHPVTCVSGITWSVDPHEAATAKLTLDSIGTEIDVEAGVFEFKTAAGETIFRSDKAVP